MSETASAIAATANFSGGGSDECGSTSCRPHTQGVISSQSDVVAVDIAEEEKVENVSADVSAESQSVCMSTVPGDNSPCRSPLFPQPAPSTLPLSLDPGQREDQWSTQSKRKSCPAESSSSPNKRLCISGDCSQTGSDEPMCTSACNEGTSPESGAQPSPGIQCWVDTYVNWSGQQRLLALDQLLDASDSVQVRHVLQAIQPRFQRDFIALLPRELALHVLSYLAAGDLLRAACTCRAWRVLAEDNLLWREKCRELQLDDLEDLMAVRRRFVLVDRGSEEECADSEQSSCADTAAGMTAVPASDTSFQPEGSTRLHCPPTVSTSTWKHTYIRRMRAEANWRSRPLPEPKVLSGHDDHVVTCLQFGGSRVVSGSDDNTLRVWSVNSGRCLRTLLGHTGGVWSSQMNSQLVISGSTDRTLKVWDLEHGTCLHTLYGHSSTVRCMHLHGDKVVSGSRDATLRVWNVVTGHCEHVLVGHVAAVRCVQYDGRLVVSGAYDYMVKVWNPLSEQCVHTLQGHNNRVYSLQFDGVHVVSGSLDTSIRVWDVNTGQCKHTLMGHQSLTSGMELKNNILVSGNADSTVKVWDIISGQCLQTLSGPNKHQSAVTCLLFQNNFVITSSDDGTVKLWDVKTGEFVRNLVSLASGGSGGVVWRIRASRTKLVCAVGSRNGTEETKLLVLDFEPDA